MAKYEYLVIKTSVLRMCLNEYSEKGWRFSGFTYNSKEDVYVMCFEREVLYNE